MEPLHEEKTCWDVSMALRDVSLEMLQFHEAGIAAPPEVVRHWHDWIHAANRAHNALAQACEEIVESGATTVNLDRMKVALTHAMGQNTYWARCDRW